MKVLAILAVFCLIAVSLAQKSLGYGYGVGYGVGYVRRAVYAPYARGYYGHGGYYGRGYYGRGYHGKYY